MPDRQIFGGNTLVELVLRLGVLQLDIGTAIQHGQDVPSMEEMLPRLVDRYRDMVNELRRTVGREMSRARNLIRSLVGGEIKLMPAGKDGLNAIMLGDYATLLSLVV